MLANEESIRKQFERIGARFRVRLQSEVTIRNPLPLGFNVVRDRQGELFELGIWSGPPLREITRLSIPRITHVKTVTFLHAAHLERHLLLLVNGTDRLLCGHDERHWFVASVAGAVTTVSAALESLKPAEVVQAQQHTRLRPKELCRRANRAFLRQGEWFFLPMKNIQTDPRLIFRNEPIQRGGSKPHLVEELFRYGGETVYVSSRFPNGLTHEQYSALIAKNPEQANQPWRLMTRNAAVYARGTVRHPDHKTIRLRGWHRVVMNNEKLGSLGVAFLD